MKLNCTANWTSQCQKNKCLFTSGSFRAFLSESSTFPLFSSVFRHYRAIALGSASKKQKNTKKGSGITWTRRTQPLGNYSGVVCLSWESNL